MSSSSCEEAWMLGKTATTMTVMRLSGRPHASGAKRLRRMT